MLKSLAASLSLLVFIVSCSSSTLVSSTDRDAKIFIDGEYRGTGSVQHEDKKIVGSTTYVTLKKEGCRPQEFRFSRSEEFAVGPCIGGVFVLVPFLWVMEYKPNHTYEFQCEKM